MQQQRDYRQSHACVKGTFRQATFCQRGRQIHRANILIGTMRVRVIGDFKTIMGWVRLALAEREAAA